MHSERGERLSSSGRRIGAIGEAGGEEAGFKPEEEVRMKEGIGGTGGGGDGRAGLGGGDRRGDALERHRRWGAGSTGEASGSCNERGVPGGDAEEGLRLDRVLLALFVVTGDVDALTGSWRELVAERWSHERTVRRVFGVRTKGLRPGGLKGAGLGKDCWLQAEWMRGRR